jgi:hypothetical protein
MANLGRWYSGCVSREARGFWPVDRPATWLRRQGAKASPETGTIGLTSEQEAAWDPCVSFPEGGELAARACALEEFVAEHNPGGYLVGNGWKGGRVATFDEAQWLFGRSDDGVPRGLERCPECGDWKGECLDPRVQEQRGEDIVVPVSCACENWNRCARCHQPLASNRLNSNLYDPRDGRIWFVPGFSGLNHRCPEQQ